MYDESDIKRNRLMLRKESLRLAFFVLPGIVAIAVGFARRWLWLAVLGAILIGWTLIFLLEMKLLPAVRYDRFLRAMQSGLRRKTAGMLVHVEDDLSYEDGLWMRRVLINVHEDGGPEGERLFFLDAAKPVPEALMGKDVILTSFDRYIVEISPLDSEEKDERCV